MSQKDRPRNEHSQWYIGAPNGVVVCVDAYDGITATGHFWHSYSEQPVAFAGLLQLSDRMEWLFDWLQFPHRGTNERHFTEQQSRQPVPAGTRPGVQPERDRIVSDESLLSKHGELGTFIVRVQHRQNSSWQGRITWMEEDKTVAFRSVWEMIRLMEGAISESEGEEGPAEELPDWFEGPKKETKDAE